VIRENSDLKGNFEARLAADATDVLIIGGGLAGLISSILLSRGGWRVKLYEKKRYPFHRVCGEYISNETMPFLKAVGLYPEKFRPEIIKTLQLTSVNGKSAELNLDLGGFGISRYTFDDFLYHTALDAGVDVVHESIEEIDHTQARVILCAHGKRSKIDYNLDRDFTHKRSPYVGVKYHIKIDHKPGLIALHNFKDGYCGISNIEDGKTNLCYLTHRSNLKKHGDVRKMEENVLFKNPFLKSIFERAEFLFGKPEVINEISFANKTCIENHVLMIGDAAGMITPLCGNGMAMAIHSAMIAVDWTDRFLKNEIKRDEMEKGYAKAWSQNFSQRLWVGRQVQRLFGAETASNFAVNLVRNVKPVANFLVRSTHGESF
jgi:flavin-dependent dehydrogenase